jgi:hypothetical protein
MKSNILFGSILAAALSVGLGAQAPTGAPQDPSSPSPRPSRDQSTMKSGGEAVTVTGCIQAADAATGTSGATGGAASSKSDSFILANVTAGSGAAGAAGTAGTAGAGASSATASQYKLTGKSEDLKKYVNSKVEIKGKVDSSSAGASPSAGAAPSSSSSSPTLHVDSVKQISPSCTP